MVYSDSARALRALSDLVGLRNHRLLATVAIQFQTQLFVSFLKNCLSYAIAMVLEQSELVQLKLSQLRLCNQIRLRKIFLHGRKYCIAFALISFLLRNHISLYPLYKFFQLQLFKYPSTLQAGMHIHFISYLRLIYFF